MKIAVAGTGYVGVVTGVCLAELGHEVTCIDVNVDKIGLLENGKLPIYEPGLQALLDKNLRNGKLLFTINPKIAYSNKEVIFLTVGTPEKEDGTANLLYIQEAAIDAAKNIDRNVIFATKSTVPVGTNAKIQQIINQNKPTSYHATVISNPEFLREGSAIFDFFHGDRIVIGANHPEAATIMEQIYLPLKIPLLKTDIRSAEMIKYASNAFLATKISFINEIAAICEKVDADIDEVAYGIGLDHRIGPHFLQAGIGYGGSCFPKDTKALVQLAGYVDHHFDLLRAVIQVNNQQQVLPVVKAKQLFPTLRGKKVALLGLAFKPNTDDVREAAALTIVEALLDEGALVTAYDPIAISNARKVLGERVKYSEEIKHVLKGADLAVITTEWDQIKHLPLETYPAYMKEAIIIDGRNCYSLEEVKKHQITYIPIGRPAIIGETSKI